MPAHRVVAIHQPNFFPWLGFFDKIVHADIFVVLNSVQFPKTGGTWTNRVRLMNGGQPQWTTAPIVRAYPGVRTIAEMEISTSEPWREKLLRSVQTNYGRAPHFDTVFPVLRPLIENPTNSLADYNLTAITTLTQAMEIDTAKFVLGSELKVSGQATELLVSIVQAVKGTAYLCGGGAADYQDDARFAAEGIELLYQNFRHPEYDQVGGGDFVSGLSIIDALMHCSFSGVRQILDEAGVQPS